MPALVQIFFYANWEYASISSHVFDANWEYASISSDIFWRETAYTPVKKIIFFLQSQIWPRFLDIDRLCLILKDPLKKFKKCEISKRG